MRWTMMPEKQIEFDPMQTHDKRFEYAMIVICPHLHRDRAGDHAVHDVGDAGLSARRRV